MPSWVRDCDKSLLTKKQTGVQLLQPVMAHDGGGLGAGIRLGDGTGRGAGIRLGDGRGRGAGIRLGDGAGSGAGIRLGVDAGLMGEDGGSRDGVETGENVACDGESRGAVEINCSCVDGIKTILTSAITIAATTTTQTNQKRNL